MLEVDVLGARAHGASLSAAAVRRLCRLAASACGIAAGHVAVHFVDADRIAVLNARHRGNDRPTDVLSFPIDGAGAAPAGAAAPAAESPEQRPGGARPGPPAPDGPPLELGDVFICPAHTSDLPEAVVHGVLHLAGMDHERDRGEMLALQARVLAAAGASLGRGAARSA